MNRKIKFRQPIIHNSKFTGWHYWGYLTGDLAAFTTPLSSNDGEIKKSDMFTGLLDKNGVEIYESDIIKWTSKHNANPEEHIDVIEWQDDYACFMLMPFVNEPSSAVMEVIGNIHEHSDLLNKTK